MDHHIRMYSLDFEMIPNASDLWENFFKTNVRSRFRTALVAEENGKIIGYTLGSIQKRPPVFKTSEEAIITDLCVTSSKRRNGVGKKLVEMFLEWAKGKGLKHVVMQMACENQLGDKFWTAMGFQPIMLIRRKTL
jgi:GNAT superfamily N-acetyltransferase